MNFTLDDRAIDPRKAQRKAENAVRNAMTEALSSDPLAWEVITVKTSRLAGHKVLDDDRAVAALLRYAPDHLRATINAQKLKPYRLTQILNQVLWRMAKAETTIERSLT